jgi:hypothetical protein
VPPEFVGVFHRKSAAEVEAEGLTPSIAIEEAPRFPVLLATHAKMLRGDASIAEVNTYQDAPRRLVVWDESLIKSRGHYLELSRIEAANAMFGVYVADSASKDAHDAHAFLSERLTALRGDYLAQREGRPALPVEPVSLSDDDELRFRAALEAHLAGRRSDDTERRKARELADFLEHVSRPVRVLPYEEAGQRIGVIRFDTVIPTSLSRLIVLDASHNIRDLTGRHDAELTVTHVPCAVKSFGAVTVRHLKAGAGREALSRSLPRRDSVLLREIVAEVKTWPEHEPGLVVTFKQSDHDARRGKLSDAEHVQAALRAEGIDPERHHWITWGQHLGVNSYAHCRHVLLVGVLRLPTLTLAAAIAGQRGDLTAPHAADPEEIRRATLSEMFHHVIQAGSALPMSLAIICSETFTDEQWQEAMPGVSVQPWAAKHATPAAVLGEHERAILRALDRVPERVSKVSTRALRGLAGLDGLARMTYTRALQRAVAASPDWRQLGRSLERSPFGPSS